MRDTYGTSIVSKYNSDFGEVSPKRLRGDIDYHIILPDQCLEDELRKHCLYFNFHRDVPKGGNGWAVSPLSRFRETSPKSELYFDTMLVP